MNGEGPAGAERRAGLRLGDLLLRAKVIDQQTLDDALVAQGASLLPLGSTLIRLGAASEADVAAALAEQLGLPAVVLSASTVDAEVLGVIPKEVAVGHRVMPLAFSGSQGLNLGLARPGQKALLDEIEFACGRATLPFVVVRAALEDTLRSAYEAKERGALVWRGARSAHEGPHLEVVQPPAAGKPLEADVSVSPSALDAFPRSPPLAPRPAGSAPLVLAVDDEPDILEMIGMALEHRGIEVRKATRGREALEQLRSCPPDLVLLDAMLPEIHGFELCSQIKRSETYRHIPVIIISAIYTGWNFSQDVRRIYGADDYVEKPFSYKELIHRVELALGKAHRRPMAPDSERAQRECVRAVKLALERLSAGQVEGALEAASAAVEADAFEPRAHFALANALTAAGRFYESISAYERVVELAPGQFSALKNLAVLYERQGFRAKAVEMWMRALETSPSDAVRQTIKAHLVDLL